MIKQRNLSNSIVVYLRDKLDVKVDVISDGYEFPRERPLVTIEQMQNNYEYNVKGREAVEVDYRFQIGLHTEYFRDRQRLQEYLSDIFIFDRFPYIDFDKSADEIVGFFDVDLEAVTPMPSDSKSRHSVKHTVYFDVEINTIKRRR